MNKSRRKFAALTLLCLIALTFGVIITLSRSRVTADSPFTPHPLTNATPQEVGQVALTYTALHFPVLSGTPQVVLARSVTNSDLDALGIAPIPNLTVEQPPFMLVILKGDFGPGKIPGISISRQPTHYQYIGYVFDLWAGVPTRTIASPDGRGFRRALNDPSLPDVPTPIPAPLLPTPVNRPHYGDIAPTIVAPSPPAIFPSPPVGAKHP